MTSFSQVFLAQESGVFVRKMLMFRHIPGQGTYLWFEVKMVEIVSTISFHNLLECIYGLLPFKIIIWCDRRVLAKRVQILLTVFVATLMLILVLCNGKLLGLGAWLSHQ